MSAITLQPSPSVHLRIPRPWMALAVSAAIHVALLWHYTLPSLEPPAPLGHWVEMVVGAKPELQTRTKKNASVDSPVNAPVENKVASPAPQAPVLGNTHEATGLSGSIGDMNGVQASVRDRYLYELEAYLNQMKTYPPRARHLQMTGRVEVAFHVHGDGSITDPHVVRPCIHDLLNQSAVALVSGAQRFRPLPPELGLSVLHVTVPIQYELN
jgi:TonB family protein